MDLLGKLGIDWRLLIAQIVNFLILLIILRKFLYKPVLKILHDRSKKIEKSLKDAEKIEKNLAQAEEEKEKQILAGKQEANKIVENSKKHAEQVKKEKLAEAKKEVEKVIKDAKDEIRSERKEMMNELRSELGDLVLLASKKLTNQTLDKQSNQKLIDQAIKELQNTKL